MKELVYCKECRYSEDTDVDLECRLAGWRPVKPDDFCSDGQKRDDFSDYVSMSTATTAILMAQNCGKCPIAETAISLYLTGEGEIPEDAPEFECNLELTAAYCMYTGAPLPWFYIIAHEKLRVPADEWKKMI